MYIPSIYITLSRKKKLKNELITYTTYTSYSYISTEYMHMWNNKTQIWLFSIKTLYFKKFLHHRTQYIKKYKENCIRLFLLNLSITI